MIDTYRSYKHADQELVEATIQIEVYRQEMKVKTNILEKIWPSMDDSIRNLQEQALQTLSGKLDACITRANSIVKQSENGPSGGVFKAGKTRKLSYALRMKDNLQTAIQDLQIWREVFNISTVLMAGSSDPELERKLPTLPSESGSESAQTLKSLLEVIHNNLPEKSTAPSIFYHENLISGQITAIPYTRSEIWENVGGIQGLQGTLIVDEMLESTDDTLHQVRTLAQLLNAGDQFGILPCEGVLRRSNDPFIECRFAFQVSPNFQHPRTLREILANGEEFRDLNERIHIGKELAKAVLFVHSARFVHKNIRPETILVMEDKTSTNRSPFLIGFERFRLAEGRTKYEGDEVWEKNLYRHPERQGPHPESIYIMQHDIYSLGVCLLEIGLGISFTEYRLQNEQLIAYPASDLEEEVNSTEKQNQRSKALKIQKRLVALAIARLPSKLGRKYTDIVVTCLMCLDKTGNAFGEEKDYRDDDGILVGVRYIEKVSKIAIAESDVKN